MIFALTTKQSAHCLKRSRNPPLVTEPLHCCRVKLDGCLAPIDDNILSVTSSLFRTMILSPTRNKKNQSSQHESKQINRFLIYFIVRSIFYQSFFETKL